MVSSKRESFRAGECCEVQTDGSVSDVFLYEEVIGGVDDTEFRAKTREFLLGKGMGPVEIDGLFPGVALSLID